MQPFTATVRDGKLTLEIDERQFIAEATRHLQPEAVVVDPRRFMEFVCEHVFTLTHDIDEAGGHPSWWRRFSEALAQAAAAADQGVRTRERVEPTCGCDPEEHDGG